MVEQCVRGSELRAREVGAKFRVFEHVRVVHRQVFCGHDFRCKFAEFGLIAVDYRGPSRLYSGDDFYIRRQNRSLDLFTLWQALVLNPEISGYRARPNVKRWTKNRS